MTSTSQHRCVFVGNIPYDTTEEQILDILREVGPVVSFRLVTDRETGKPKGYGFCEYKDEETALSARRNLQGYEINGRQLRVDFADNDKNADRNREQGRGGPGMALNLDHQKQVGGPAVNAESAQHQPIGLHIAINAATVMAGVLGGSQSNMQVDQNGLQRKSALATDPLTLQLAKMPRSQLIGILSDLKAMAIQNREGARQLLLSMPQLSKALFQAQIMLGMVTPQMLQMPNIRQSSGQPSVPLGQNAQTQAVQAHPRLPSLVPSNSVPQMTEVQMPPFSQNFMGQNLLSAIAQPSLHPQSKVLHQASIHTTQRATLPGHSGVPPLPPVKSSVKPQTPIAGPLSFNQNMQPSVVQQPVQVATANLGHSSHLNSGPAPGIASQLLPDVESNLLQQVLSLTAEQLNSLPPEQRQQVIQLQQALRRDQM